MKEQRPASSVNQDIRDLQQEQPGQPVVETKAQDNRFQLPNGKIPGLMLGKVGTVVTGGYDSTVAGRSVLGGSATLRAIQFEDGADTLGAELVRVKATGRIVFMGCTFKRDLNGAHVAVDAGAKVSFVGCSFLGASKTGAPILHTGAPANVTVVGGDNLTSLAHVAVTPFGEV